MSIATVIGTGFAVTTSPGLVVLFGYGTLPLQRDTHDGILYDGYPKRKLAPGLHYFGTFTRREERLKQEEKQVIEEAIALIRQVPELPDLRTEPTPAETFLNQAREFQDVAIRLRELEHQILEERRNAEDEARITALMAKRYQDLITEEQQLVALQLQLARKIKELNEEEEVALMLVLTQ